MKTKDLQEFNNADSFNLLVNNGAAAGQVIYHVSSNPFFELLISAILEEENPHCYHI